jgi:hypothetical protein
MANPTSAAAMMPNVQHGTTWRHAAIGEQGGHLRQRTILGDRLSGDTMTRIQERTRSGLGAALGTRAKQ